MSESADPDTSSGLLRLLTGVGDEAAWRTFVARYAPLIERACRAARLQPADADEVRDRVLARMVTALREFCYDPAKSFRGYLRAATANAIRSYWRERVRPGVAGAGGSDAAQQLDQLAVPDPLASLADSLDEEVTHRLRLIHRVLEKIRGEFEATTWAAYWQTSIEGRKAADVARDLGKSIGAVYMAKSRVAKRLEAVGRELTARPDPERTA